MLQLRTLANKKEFTKPNGDVVLDLIRRAVSFLGVRVKSGRIYVVTDETAMRPDLISNYFYQDSGYLDLLLKYNGYSNPFALNIGDVLRIPNSEVLAKFGTVGNQQALNLNNGSRKKAVNLVLAPKSKKDQARLNYLLQRGNTADSNLAKLNTLLQSGNLSALNLSTLSGQLSTILQGGNFSGTGPLNSAYQSGNTVPVPPNLALDSGVKLQNGRIIFGSDVTSVKKQDCTEPISRTKLKETLIKNKLA